LLQTIIPSSPPPPPLVATSTESPPLLGGGTSAPMPTLAGGEGGPFGPGSVVDIDSGATLFAGIIGNEGLPSSDPLTDIAPVTPATQPEPIPVSADTPLGGPNSNLFLENGAGVADDQTPGIDTSPSSSGNEAIWFRVRGR